MQNCHVSVSVQDSHVVASQTLCILISQQTIVGSNISVQKPDVVAPCRTGYTRVIVEKPFGKDSESFRKLSADLYQHLTEDQMYRIDHYLGKELIENLTVCFSLSHPAAWPKKYWLGWCLESGYVPGWLAGMSC